jgi:hypothetical protein
MALQPTGIRADADILGIDCAKVAYGTDLIEEVVLGQPGMPRYEDDDGNEITVVFDDEEICGSCFKPVCKCKGPGPRRSPW